MPDEQTIKILRALGDPIRFGIVRKLAAGDCDCDQSFEELASGSTVSQPSMSHHFSRLVDANIVIEYKEGRSKYCQLNRELLSAIGIDIITLTAP